MIFDRLFKNESNTRILTSQQLGDYLAERNKSGSGVVVTPERALMLAAVFSCVRVLAESVGQLPVHLFKRTGSRDKEKAFDHPLYQLLHVAPNDFQTAQEWKEGVVASLALRGNHYSHINRVRGRVAEIVPFETERVTPKQHPKSLEVFYEIASSGTKPDELPAREVLHHKLMPLRGIVGASPIRYAREAIGLGISAEKHGAGLFARGATLSGTLESPNALTKPAQDRLKQTFEEQYAGSDKAWQVAVLEEGLKFNSVTMPSKDAQWLESRKYQRSEIAGIFRVPPHLIGDLDRATFGNIEEQGLNFVIHTMMPWLTRIEQRNDLQLLTADERREYFSKHNAAALLRGNMVAKSAYYTQQIQNGVLSPNEVRELEDLNAREGGDVYLTPSNLLHDGKLPAAKDANPPAPADPEPEQE